MKTEELRDELSQYLQEEDRMIILKHPLVTAVPYLSQFNHLYNQSFLLKNRRFQNFLCIDDYKSMLTLVERPHRLSTFIKYQSLMDNEQYWECLRFVWTDAEFVTRDRDIYLQLFLNMSREEQRIDDYITCWSMMDLEEKTRFSKLDSVVKIFRGGTEINKKGLSWTISPNTASWFANRFNQKGKIFGAEIKKTQIFAFFTGRGEEEVVVLKKKIKNLSLTK